jgi:hypothetical protein
MQQEGWGYFGKKKCCKQRCCLRFPRSENQFEQGACLVLEINLGIRELQTIIIIFMITKAMFGVSLMDWYALLQVRIPH